MAAGDPEGLRTGGWGGESAGGRGRGAARFVRPSRWPSCSSATVPRGPACGWERTSMAPTASIWSPKDFDPQRVSPRRCQRVAELGDRSWWEPFSRTPRRSRPASSIPSRGGRSRRLRALSRFVAQWGSRLPERGRGGATSTPFWLAPTARSRRRRPRAAIGQWGFHPLELSSSSADRPGHPSSRCRWRAEAPRRCRPARPTPSRRESARPLRG